MIYRHAFFFLAIFCVTSSYARPFKDNLGRTIEADIVEADDKMVSLKKGNKVYKFEVKNLSSEDQEYVKQWMAENPKKTNYEIETKIRKETVEGKKTYRVVFSNKKGQNIRNLTIVYRTYVEPSKFSQERMYEDKIELKELPGWKAAEFLAKPIPEKSPVELDKGVSDFVFGRRGNPFETKRKGIRVKLLQEGRVIVEAQYEESAGSLKFIDWDGNETKKEQTDPSEDSGVIIIK